MIVFITIQVQGVCSCNILSFGSSTIRKCKTVVQVYARLEQSHNVFVKHTYHTNECAGFINSNLLNAASSLLLKMWYDFHWPALYKKQLQGFRTQGLLNQLWTCDMLKNNFMISKAILHTMQKLSKVSCHVPLKWIKSS